jgi:uncharacterized Zn-finger protein
MAKVHYVTCSVCRKEYYLDQMLYEAIISNPKQILKCPFCKNEFHLEIHKESPPQNNLG